MVFRFGWIYRLVRKNSNPIEENKALLWKRRLSFLYGALAFNAFGLVVISALSGKVDWADYYGLKTEEEKSIPPGRQWALSLGIKNAKVVRYSGFTKVGEYEISEEETPKTETVIE